MRFGAAYCLAATLCSSMVNKKKTGRKGRFPHSIHAARFIASLELDWPGSPEQPEPVAARHQAALPAHRRLEPQVLPDLRPGVKTHRPAG